MKKHKIVLSFILIISGLVWIYSCTGKQTIELKVMSYNICHGLGLDSVLDLSRAANIIKTQAPDLCGLQEVDDSCSRSFNIKQTEYLAKLTSMNGTFGKFMNFQNGEYGMATLIRKPIISTKILELPDAILEPRVSIINQVQLSETCTIAFANIHLDWAENKKGSANRLNQAKVLVKYLDSLNLATIIIGDFNCSPNAPTMQYFIKHGFVFIKKGEDNLSYQGDPKLEIDYIIYKDKGSIKFKKKSIHLLKVPNISDHRPLVAEIEVSF
jgi:endonuclease/exonuclease/phosphatase family metal-dependent hydrolase